MDRPILFSAPMIRALLSGTKTQTRRIVNLDKLRVRLPYEVRSDLPAIIAPRAATRGSRPVALNPQGAVSVRSDDGEILGVKPGEFDFECPYAVGTTRLHEGKWKIEPHGVQRLCVRESWATEKRHNALPPRDVPRTARIHYLADGPKPSWSGRSRVARFMVRWMSRITLELTDVRIGRLQEITEEDAKAEGVKPTIFESWSFYDPQTDSYPSMLSKPTAEYIARYRLENVRHHGPREIVSAAHNFKMLWWQINGVESWDANPWVWALGFRRVAQAQEAARGR